MNEFDQSVQKPEETSRAHKCWYIRIKDGEVKSCPVESCGGTLAHDGFVTQYQCEACGWTDELQDLQDMGYQKPRPGWPRVTRTCAVCGAKGDGSAMPMIEFFRCQIHPEAHFLCRWRLDVDGHVVECACSAGKVTLGKMKVCSLGNAEERGGRL